MTEMPKRAPRLCVWSSPLAILAAMAVMLPVRGQSGLVHQPLTSTLSNVWLVVGAPSPGAKNDAPVVTDVVAFLDDFKAKAKNSGAFEVTLYADQPGTGGDRDVIEGHDRGHTFIGLRSGPHEIRLGFYPSSSYSLLQVIGNTSKPNRIRNDADHPWDVKKTWRVDSESAKRIQEQIKSWKSKQFNLRRSNGSDFAIDVLRAGGITPPSGKKTSWPKPLSHVKAANSGDLGEDLMLEGGMRSQAKRG